MWDENLKRFQDWDLWLTMGEQGKTGVWVDEYLFRVLTRKNGMSAWLPSFVYKVPFRWIPGLRRAVLNYDKAKKLVVDKHGI